MLPDIQVQDRLHAPGQGRFLIGGGDDLQSAVSTAHQIGIAGAKDGQGALSKLLLKFLCASEAAVDGTFQQAGGPLSGGGSHAVKEKLVVIHAAGIA